MAKIPCPNCNEELTVNLDAPGSQLYCPKCRVLLQLDKNDGDKRSLFDLRRLLRKKVNVGLACQLV